MGRGRAIAAVLSISGCAHFEPREPVLVKEEVLETRRVETPTTGSVVTFSTQGESLAVEAHGTCDVAERSTVDRVVSRTYENKTPGIDVALAVASVALTGGGVIVVADSADATSEASASRVVGSTMILGGLFMGGAAFVDLMRGRKVVYEKHTATKEGPRIAHDVACAQSPLADADVELRIGRTSWLAGHTDATGHFTAPIANAVGPDAKLPLKGATAKVIVQGRAIGDLGLHSLAAQREELSWRALNVQECADPLAVDACVAVTRFLEDFPDGPHAREAGSALAKAEPQLMKLRDDMAWRRVAAAVPTCAGKGTADAVEHACLSLARYAKNFPDGEHVREAEKASTAGLARVPALRAAEAKKKEADDGKRGPAAPK